MRSSLVVIFNVLPHQMLQLATMEDEHIVQAFPFQAVLIGYFVTRLIRGHRVLSSPGQAISRTYV
jgi:thiosulfate reductase cytochrome b subunit